MNYNVKVTFYDNEIQLSMYDYYILKGDADNEITEQSFVSDKQSDKAGKQSDKADNESDKVKSDKADKAKDYARSARRSKQAIYELCRANRWDWFVTFTFSDNRYDYKSCRTKLQTFLKNFSVRKTHIEYIVVPELHKDGAYHFHGLLQGNLEPFLVNAWNSDRFSLKGFKYGLNELERVRDSNKASAYITKYITKELNVSLQSTRRYFVSQGLKRPRQAYFNNSNKDMFDFIQSNFPSYRISYMNNASWDNKEINYIQLKEIKEDI